MVTNKLHYELIVHLFLTYWKTHFGLGGFYSLDRGQMINQEDYTMIADYDCMGVEERASIIEQKGDQVVIIVVIINNYLTRLSEIL